MRRGGQLVPAIKLESLAICGEKKKYQSAKGTLLRSSHRELVEKLSILPANLVVVMVVDAGIHTLWVVVVVGGGMRVSEPLSNFSGTTIFL